MRIFLMASKSCYFFPFRIFTRFCETASPFSQKFNNFELPLGISSHKISVNPSWRKFQYFDGAENLRKISLNRFWSKLSPLRFEGDYTGKVLSRRQILSRGLNLQYSLYRKHKYCSESDNFIKALWKRFSHACLWPD